MHSYILSKNSCPFLLTTPFITIDKISWTYSYPSNSKAIPNNIIPFFQEVFFAQFWYTMNIGQDFLNIRYNGTTLHSNKSTYLSHGVQSTIEVFIP